jgi:Glutamine amidotransferases class-II
MARLFGIIGNRVELVGRVLALESNALRVLRSVTGNPSGWGIGFHQNGEVLLRRKPIDTGLVLDPQELAGNLRCDSLLGHVRTATIGDPRPENTHPFRYRNWLFAQTGTLPFFVPSEGGGQAGAGTVSARARLLEVVSDHLRANVAGETDAELVFQIFVSFLGDGGALGTDKPKVVIDALRATMSTVSAVASEFGSGAVRVNLLASNGDMMVGANFGEPMSVRVFSGRSDAELLLGDDPALRRRVPEIGRVRFSLVASDFSARSLPPSALDREDAAPSSGLPSQPWTPLHSGGFVALTREDEPIYEPA